MRMFLKLPGFLGSSTEKRHIHWIELASFAALGPQPHQVGGMSTFARDHDFTFAKSLDQSSERLAQAVAMGTQFPTVTAEFVDKNGQLVVGYDFRGVRLTSYRIKGKWEEFTMEHGKVNVRLGPGMK